MSNKIVLLCCFYCFVNIINGDYLEEESLKREIDVGLQNRILQPLNQEVTQLKIYNKITEATNQYLRLKVENLESRLAQPYQEKGYDRIGTLSVVNHGHIQFSENSGQGVVTPNKTDVKIQSPSENLLQTMLLGKVINNSQPDIQRSTQQLTTSTGKTDLISSTSLPKDCSEIQNNESGLYTIKPSEFIKPFIVYCDLETNGGGWTVFQHRFDGLIEFYRKWNDYKFGFGNILGEHWLGLEKLHQLTNFQINELYIILEDFDNETRYAQYSSFGIGSEDEGYRLSFLGSYNGTAGDSLLIHKGYKFSTYDKDQDVWVNNCAETYTGAWWYSACVHSNLNGKYLKGDMKGEKHAQGVDWLTWRGHYYSLKTTKMMIRPRRR